MKFCISLLCALVLSGTCLSQQNELLAVKSYTLDNGLKVFLNPDSTATRVFGAVMVNAGAKHEDPTATGMAHYLEHLLFKGTDEMGTWDYEAEKVHLDSVNYLYDQLAKATSPEEKVLIQNDINQQALKASEFGLPNEFDKLLRSIGSTAINAFTNYEMTFYHNSFPGHEINRWLDIYSTRFQNPVFRSFQSELEVVYEEKNRAMDDFERKVYEKTSTLLFPNLPYGQWSVLGTVGDLKFPSINKMYDFYHKHYVPGNMALILTGDFNPDYVTPLIQEKFGQWEPGPVPELDMDAIKPFSGEEVEKVRITPVKAGFLGYHTPPRNHADREAMDLCEYLLFNQGQTGFINQLQLNNEMIYAGAFSSVYNNAGGFVVFFVPKILIQSLGNAQSKVEDAINRIKTGDFSENQFLSAKNELSRTFQSNLENLTNRGTLIGGAYNAGFTWEEALGYPDRIEKISREEVIRVAQKYFGEDRMKMISRTGFGKPTKLEKPPFKPVVTEQTKSSAYASSFEQLQSLPFEPRFLDFDKDIERAEVSGGHQVITTANPINDLFSLELRFKKGIITDPKIEYAAKVANDAGAGEYGPSELKEAFASIGCRYSFSIDPNYLTVRLTGVEANLESGLELLNTFLTDLKPTDKSLKVLMNSEYTNRKLEKGSPNTMGRIMLNYASFGDASYYKMRLAKKELKKLDVEVLKKKFHEITQNYEAEIIFNGNKSADELAALVEKKLSLSKSPDSEPYQYRDLNPNTATQILLIDDKKAVQSQVWFHLVSDPVSAEDHPQIEAFNNYFGGGFSGLVTQEIREYRSLAYSTGASFLVPPLPDTKTRFYGFIGCQSDKTTEAIKVMAGLIDDMPLKADRIPTLQKSLQMQVITDFPDLKNIPESILDYERMDYAKDPNRKAYDAYSTLRMDEIDEFYRSKIQGRPYIITIYGDKKRINLDQLKAIGPVKELSIDDVAKF